jgi:hypothetical protein
MIERLRRAAGVDLLNSSDNFLWNMFSPIRSGNFLVKCCRQERQASRVGVRTAHDGLFSRVLTDFSTYPSEFPRSESKVRTTFLLVERKSSRIKTRHQAFA